MGGSSSDVVCYRARDVDVAYGEKAGGWDFAGVGWYTADRTVCGDFGCDSCSKCTTVGLLLGISTVPTESSSGMAGLAEAIGVLARAQVRFPVAIHAHWGGCQGWGICCSPPQPLHTSSSVTRHKDNPIHTK